MPSWYWWGPQRIAVLCWCHELVAWFPMLYGIGAMRSLRDFQFTSSISRLVPKSVGVLRRRLFSLRILVFNLWIRTADRNMGLGKLEPPTSWWQIGGTLNSYASFGCFLTASLHAWLFLFNISKRYSAKNFPKVAGYNTSPLRRAPLRRTGIDLGRGK